MKKLSLTLTLLGSLFASQTFASEYDKPGLVTELEDARLWLFREGCQELKDFKERDPAGLSAYSGLLCGGPCYKKPLLQGWPADKIVAGAGRVWVALLLL
ncbi:MAG: hypothetical protein WA173_05170 [Pseudomonas sp.]|uniref:hypothetical protein n=1 Tax=Pseudomonas sp. TaxID=306 RepID=UPI003BB5170A